MGRLGKKNYFVCQTTTVVIKYLKLETFEDNFNILEWSETDKHNVPIFQLKPQDSGLTTKRGAGWSGEDNNSGIFFFLRMSAVCKKNRLHKSKSFAQA